MKEFNVRFADDRMKNVENTFQTLDLTLANIDNTFEKIDATLDSIDGTIKYTLFMVIATLVMDLLPNTK